MHHDNPFTADEEEELLATVNQRFAARLPRPPVDDDADAAPLAVGLDGCGVDLRCASHCYRLALSRPAGNPDEFTALLGLRLSAA